MRPSPVFWFYGLISLVLLGGLMRFLIPFDENPTTIKRDLTKIKDEQERGEVSVADVQNRRLVGQAPLLLDSKVQVRENELVDAATRETETDVTEAKLHDESTPLLVTTGLETKTKPLHVYEKIVSVTLVDLGDKYVGAIELVLHWNSRQAYPVDQTKVCDDRSRAVVFQQGKLIPGEVRLGILMPVLTAAREVVDCHFNLVTDNEDLAFDISIQGSNVYAIDGAVIASGDAAFKVFLQ